MKNVYEKTLSLVIVLAIMVSVFLIPPAGADDQAKSIVSPGPPVTSTWTLYDIAWDETNWSYAIAVGTDTSTGSGLVKKYDPATQTWINIMSRANSVFYDVVADTIRPDTFYVVGTYAPTPNTMASVIEHAGTTPAFTDLPGYSSQGTAFYGCTFDPWTGNNGTLIAVGSDASSNGLVDKYDIDTQTWSAIISNKYDVLEDATWDYNGADTIFVVGHHNETAVAYSYDYSNLYTIPAPSDAGAFHGIDWKTNDYSGYALIVGQSTSGSGKVWMLDTSWSFTEVSGTNASTPILNGVDWDIGGNMAVIVGDMGSVYVHYGFGTSVADWSDPSFTQNIYGVAVKSPHSPGYGLGVGVSSAPKISYQVADSSTAITLDTAFPHITNVEFRDQSNVNRMNQQVDTGNTYYFYIDAYYMISGADHWSDVNISIQAWYDDGSEISDFASATQGGNIRFRLDYDGTTWSLVEPTTDEITLGAAGTEWTYTDGDGNTHHVVSINVTFREQVRWAPGDGTWNAATDTSSPTGAFNDADSWNFNVTAFDRVNTNAKASWYDEFGIFAYTEISASQNPAGAGPPGTNITLSPDSQLSIRANRDYYVTVNVTDLKNATGGSTIPRSDIWVVNNNADAAGNSDIDTLTPFPSGELWVWGLSSGTYMDPMDNGTYTAGNQYGYDSSPVYTNVGWQVSVPAGTPEDHFTATITYTVTYS